MDQGMQVPVGVGKSKEMDSPLEGTSHADILTLAQKLILDF